MANQNFTNFVTRYNKPKEPVQPTMVNQPAVPAGLYPQKPAGLNPQPQKVSGTKQPVDLAQQAVDLGYVKSREEYLGAEQRGRDLATKIPQTITSDTLKRGKDIEVPELPTPPVSRTDTTAGAKRTPTEPVITEKPQSLKEQTQAYLKEQLAGGGQIDTAKERETLRINEKMKRATDLDNEIIATKQRYEDQIEELEKNPEGKLSGNLTQQVNRLRQEANKELADLSIQYKIANDDYVGAEKVLSDRIADMKDQRNYQLQVFNASVNAIENDLTESEKMALAQQYRLDEIDYENTVKSTETEGKSAILQAQADNYQNLLSTGQISLKDVPKEVMGYMNTRGYVSPEQQTAKTQTTNLINSFDQFRKLGATGAVGAPVSKILPYVGSLFGVGNYAADKSLVQNIKAQLTLNNLSFLKGAMSDKDIAFITQASSSLNDNMSESQFKKELVNIQGKFVNGILNSPAYSMDEKEDALTKQLILEYPKATDNEILDLVSQKLPQQTSFNSAGNASASNLASAIKTVESGGNYQARGPVVTSGQYKGERALGAYQIMPGNLPSWSKEALGYSVSQDEFLRSPEIQDAIAQSRFSNLLAKYSPEDASAIWFSGRPLSGNTSSDVTGTNTRQYVSRVINNLTA